MELTLKDFLSFGTNKRLVEAVEHLCTRKENPINRSVLAKEMGIPKNLYYDIKHNRRGLPTKYIDRVALALLEHGISPEWYRNGSGGMLINQPIVSEENMIIEMLRNELRVKENYIRSLEDQLKQMRVELSLKKVGHKVGQITEKIDSSVIDNQ
jgi:hypothetical protein